VGRIKADYNWQNTGKLVFYDAGTFETLDPLGFPVKVLDDFFGVEFLEDSVWETEEEGTGNAVGVSAALNGVVQIDTGTVADKSNSLFGGLNFKAASQAHMEIRVTPTTSQAGLFLAFGFSDVGGEGAGKIAWKDDSLVSGTVDAWADDAVMFGCRQETSVNIYALSVKGAGTPQSTDTGTDLATDTYHIYRIDLDSSGNARYFIDGVLVAAHSSAVTAADPLVPTVQTMITTGSTAAFVNIDYIKVWGGRS
jgi:hypothetical protein